jgi:hypothetical protein
MVGKDKDSDLFQSLMRRLNFAGQLSPLMQGFKYNLNRMLGQLQNGKYVVLTEDVRSDLLVWTNFILDEDPWPLCLVLAPHGL